MTLYHGSYVEIQRPDISFSRDNVDFGRGFYVTPIKEQAVSWSGRFKRKYGFGVVSAYDVDECALRANTLIAEFETYSDEWLDFIVSCRRGDRRGDFDVVIGGVANDKVFDTIQLFFDGLIDKTESIKRLRYEKPNLQYCFRTQTVIDDYLNFITSEVV